MSVRPIDSFVGAMYRDHGDELLIETGRAVRMRVGQTERVLLAQEVRTDQINKLLKDVIPVDCQRTLQQDGEAMFPYSSPSGAVAVRVQQQQQKISVSIQPYSVAQKRIKSGVMPVTLGTDTTLELETPLDNVMKSVPGRPLTPPPSMPKTQLSPIKHAVDEDGPMELKLESLSPPALSEDALSPLPMSALSAAEQNRSSRPRPRPEIPIATSTVHAVAEPVKKEVEFVREDAPTITQKQRRGIDPVLYALVRLGASDIHLTAGLPGKMRLDGEMATLTGYEQPITSEQIEEWLMEIAPRASQEKFRDTSDADFGYEVTGLARFRVNVFRDRRGVGGVIRVIPSKIPTMESLRLPSAIGDLCGLTKGLVVVTGPTGSGKSTTLASMLEHVNQTRGEHVISIEDPIEFVYEPKKSLVNQREIHTHTESFASALRAALREDPDIIMVGELRDLETTAIAIETAETGHLVFGTLHTTTAISTVDRIVDQFPGDRQTQVRIMLSEGLKGVISQTLCKKKGGGRVAAHEILVVTPAIANLIREAKTFQIASIMQTSKNIGMQTLNDALLKLVNEGLIEPSEAYRRSVQRTEMKALLDRAGHAV